MVRALTTLRLAPVSFLVAIGLLSMLGLAGAWAVAQNATTLGVVLWMLPSVVVGALFTVYGTALLQGSIAGSTVDFDRRVLWRQGRILSAIFVIFTVTVSIVGILYVKDLGTSVRQQRFDQQEAIASVKTQLVQSWLVERSLETQQRARSIGSLLADSGGRPTRETRSLIEVLFAEMLASSPDRSALNLYAPDGQRLAGAGEAIEPDEIPRLMAAPSRGTAFQPRIGQRRLPASGPLRLDFVTPVVQAIGQPPMAILVVTFDPAVSLLPELLRWPTEDANSEMAIIQKQGDRAASVVLPSRGLRDGRNQISFPLTDTANIGVQVVTNGDGVREGLDYRNVPVLAASRHVAELDWHIVAKTDVAAALTPIEQRANLVTWLTLGAILVAAAASLGLWHAEKASLVALQERHKRDRTALAHHYEQMIKSARDIVLLVDDDMRVIEANAAALSAYGYSLDELRAMRAIDFRPASEKAALSADWLTIHTDEKTVETLHQRKDGSVFPVEITGNFFDIDHRRYFQAFIRDISARKRLEAELKRLSRVQTALQAASRLLLSAREERALLQSMCDLLIEIAGYRLVHVAVPVQDDAKSVEFVARAGLDNGYLAQTRITWGDGPRSRGPTGGALRTGEVQINQDFDSNSEMAPWREEALKRGMRSSIGLPLRGNDVVVAVLTIYSEQPFAFNKDEVDFLMQFSADISYGVTLLRNRAA